MGQTATIPESMLLRHAGFVLAKLRRSVEAWETDDDEGSLLKIACLAFVANAHLLTREIVDTRATFTSAALLQRTLWHNAGLLAWLLNGQGELADRLDVFQADHDIRAVESLLDRPICMFGHTIAGSFISKEDEEAATYMRTQAELAKQRVQETEMKPWARIPSKELRKALQKAIAVAKAEFGESVEAMLRRSEDASASGDDIAHPNAFAMLSTLSLVDLEAIRIQRPLNVVPIDTAKTFYATGNLLLVHGVAIYAHKKKLFPLNELLESLSSSLSRCSDS